MSVQLPICTKPSSIQLHAAELSRRFALHRARANSTGAGTIHGRPFFRTKRSRAAIEKSAHTDASANGRHGPDSAIAPIAFVHQIAASRTRHCICVACALRARTRIRVRTEDLHLDVESCRACIASGAQDADFRIESARIHGEALPIFPACVSAWKGTNVDARGKGFIEQECSGSGTGAFAQTIWRCDNATARIIRCSGHVSNTCLIVGLICEVGCARTT